MHRVPLTLLLVVAVACSPSLDVPEGAAIACVGNEDCPVGYTCRTGARICVSDNVDVVQPAIVSGSVAQSHELARAGVEVTVSFESTVDLARPPDVRLAAATQIPWELDSQSGRTYAFSYVPNGEEGDGLWQIVADLTSTKGVLSRNLGVTGIRLDFIDPAPATGSALITPPPASTLRAVRRAAGGSTIQVWAPTTEPVLVESGAMLEIVCDQRRESLPLVPSSSTPTLLVFLGAWTCNGTERVDCHYEIDLEDLAGNRVGDIEIPGLELAVDCEPPPASIDTVAVKHLRVPWGSDETKALDPSPVGQFLVRSDYQPGDDLFADLPFSAFGLTSDEIAQALVLGEMDEILGVIEPTESGGWQAIRLATSDSPEIYLAVVDSAGNVSLESEVVRHSEWVATFGNKVVGSTLENPHRFLFRPVFAADVRLTGIEASSGLVQQDGSAETGGGRPSWARISDTSAPQNRFHPAIAHDSLRGVTVLFGGHQTADGSPALYNDTWEHNGRIWLAITPTDFEGDGNPIGRTMPAMAFDERRGVTVMVGGCVDYDPTGTLDWTCVTPSDDVWEWDGERWQARCDGVPAADVCVAPPARIAAAAAYDARSGVVAVYGGCLDGTCTSIDDSLWFWDGRSWTQQTGQAPGALYGASLTFDRGAGELILFGGAASGVATEAASDETWTWNGSWTQRASTAAARVFGGAAFDRGRNQVVRLGGMAAVGACDDEATADRNLYGWDGSQWQTLSSVSGLFALQERCLGLAYQASEKQLLLAARFYLIAAETPELASSLNTSLLRTDTWQLARQDALVSIPTEGAAAYDDNEGEPLIVGPSADGPWHINHLGWTACDPSGMAGFPCDTLHRSGQGLVFDHTNNRLIAYGGNSGSEEESSTDVWDWMMMGWQNVNAGTVAGDRADHTFTEGPGGALVAFGGDGKEETLWADTCLLSSATWSCPALVAGTTEPTARAEHAAAFHEAADVVVLFGGREGQTAPERLDDTWVFAGSRWYPVSTSVHPLARADHVMEYDSAREEVLMVFGENKTDAWAFRPGTTVGEGAWHPLAIDDPERDGNPRVVAHPFSWVAPEGIVVGGYFGDEVEPEFWVYRGNGDQRPAAMVQLRVGSQVRLDTQRLDALEITWVGGASGDDPGADLFLWRNDTWELLTERASATVDAPETFAVTVEDDSDPEWADAILVGDPEAIYLALVPKGVNGSLPDYARITTDYFEARLRTSAR